MTPLKVLGVVAGTLFTAAVVGGGIYWWRKTKASKAGGIPQVPTRPSREPVPSRPPRGDEHHEAEETKPSGYFRGTAELHPDLRKAIDEEFSGDAWPPDDKTIDSLEPDDVIVFAVESEPKGNYTNTRQELMSAKVLSVEKNVVRARIIAPVAHAEHHGSHAGHGFRVGQLVEVPRSQVLVAARPTGGKREGYNSTGPPARTFKPSSSTKEIYSVKPGTPYDLLMPYRTAELEWYVDEKLVEVEHLGEKGLLEQIRFSEGSLRGEVSLRAIDHDPEAGSVFVARWDFVIGE